jgi:hypothetical protein
MLTLEPTLISRCGVLMKIDNGGFEFSSCCWACAGNAVKEISSPESVAWRLLVACNRFHSNANSFHEKAG